MEFEITPDDRRALVHQLRRAPEARRQARSAFLKAFGMSSAPLVVIVWVLLLGHADLRAYIVLVAFPFACDLALWLFAYPRAKRSQLEQFANPPGGIGLGQHVLTLSPAGVEERQPYGHSLHRWPFVKAILFGQNHVFIPVAGGGHYIVPKRAFRSEEEFARFTEEFKAQLEGAA